MRRDQPDLYSRTRPGVLVAFVVVWNLPVAIFILRYGLTPPHARFELLAIVQSLSLAAVFSLVAFFGRLQRLVFRGDIGETEFRRPLLSAAAFALVIAVVLWLTTFGLR